MVNAVGTVACCVIDLCLSGSTSYPCLWLRWHRTSPCWPWLIPQCCTVMVSPMSQSLRDPWEMDCSSEGCLLEIK